MDRLISARVEEQRRQQAKAKKRDRRPPRLQAEEHQQAAAEFSQNNQRQQPAVNPMGLHIVCDAGITRDLPGALDDKNVGQHRPGKQTERTNPPDKKIEVSVKSTRLDRRRDPPRVYCACDIVAPPQSRRADPWRASAKSRLERVRLRQHLGQILVILAVLTTKLLDRRQLLSGELIVALDDIGLPKVLAHLRVVWIERN